MLSYSFINWNCLSYFLINLHNFSQLIKLCYDCNEDFKRLSWYYAARFCESILKSLVNSHLDLGSPIVENYCSGPVFHLRWVATDFWVAGIHFWVAKICFYVSISVLYGSVLSTHRSHAFQASGQGRVVRTDGQRIFRENKFSAFDVSCCHNVSEKVHL